MARQLPHITAHVPLCQPAGWVALWRKLSAISALNL